jgi:hypothetical protein
MAASEPQVNLKHIQRYNYICIVKDQRHTNRFEECARFLTCSSEPKPLI